MKTFIIIVLLLALGGGAVLSRPQDPKKSFAHYLMNSEKQSPVTARAQADACVFQDYILWIDVKRGGRSVYTNVFHHWFSHAAINTAFAPATPAAHTTASTPRSDP
jgi:hypothetical protein